MPKAQCKLFTRIASFSFSTCNARQRGAIILNAPPTPWPQTKQTNRAEPTSAAHPPPRQDSVWSWQCRRVKAKAKAKAKAVVTYVHN